MLSLNLLKPWQCKVSSLASEGDYDKGKFQDELSEGAALLNDALNRNKEIAFFHQSEIKTGKLLGKGSFSKVCEVRNIRLKKDATVEHHEARCSKRVACSTKNAKYAMKQLKKSTLSSDKFAFAVNDLVNEARFLALLDHEGIIKIHGISNGGTKALSSGRHEGFFIVIDRFPITLDQQILEWADGKGGAKENTLKMLPLKTRISLQIAEAVAYMHERRIIFRDLKPQNVGFKGDGENVAIFDFGSCRELPEEKRADEDGCYKMSIAGTLRYLAPEIFSKTRYNTKADVYSWAILYYRMLALSNPYRKYDYNLYKKNVGKLGVRPDIESLGLPQATERVLTDAWAQSVSNRLSMEEVCQQLRTILKDTDENSADAQDPKLVL